MSADLLNRPSDVDSRRAGAHRSARQPTGATASVSGPRESPESPLPKGALVSRSVFVCLSLVMVWLVLYALAFSGLQEQRSQHELYAKLRVELAGETAPVNGVIRNGTPVSLMTAPAAGLHNAVVVEGTSSTDMQKGPGHLVDTALPGQVGVSAILGKGVTFGGPFSRITKLVAGDPITMTTGQGVAHYVVTDVRRAGDPLPPALSAGQGRLTLVTVVGDGWRSGWAPDQTVYVDAALQGSALQPGAARLSGLPAGQAPMDGDTTAINPLILWLELLLIVVVGVTWARGHWGGWQLWLAGAPLVLAIGWMVTETAARLLPNLL
jgi:sortase A